MRGGKREGAGRKPKTNEEKKKSTIKRIGHDQARTLYLIKEKKARLISEVERKQIYEIIEKSIPHLKKAEQWEIAIDLENILLIME